MFAHALIQQQILRQQQGDARADARGEPPGEEQGALLVGHDCPGECRVLNACGKGIMDGMCKEVLDMFERDILAHFDEKDSFGAFF